MIPYNVTIQLTPIIYSIYDAVIDDKQISGSYIVHARLALQKASISLQILKRHLDFYVIHGGW